MPQKTCYLNKQFVALFQHAFVSVSSYRHIDEFEPVFKFDLKIIYFFNTDFFSFTKILSTLFCWFLKQITTLKQTC